MSPVMQLIARSGQTHKFLIGIGLLVSGLVILLLGGFFLEPLTIARLIPLSIVASGLGVFGFTYLCTTVRCQNCGARWIWLMATRRPGDSGHIDFRSDKCPVCGSAG